MLFVTAAVCASKAFDRLNHSKLISKLIESAICSLAFIKSFLLLMVVHSSEMELCFSQEIAVLAGAR
jgi:hypothetical protein